jgi:F-type H+-transporting ATPase subunit beta
VRGFTEIIEGKHDELPEGAFYRVGTIDEAIERGRELAGEEREEAPQEEAGEAEEPSEAEAEPAAV